MDLAYAAADLALCRAGAVTVAELSAVGLPGASCRCRIGNGEQRRNALPVVEAGGGLLVEDADLTADLDRAARSCRCSPTPPRWPGTPGTPRRPGCPTPTSGWPTSCWRWPRRVSAATWPPGRPPCRRCRSSGAVHFVGIGGAGMSGIARILLARGVRVSGSDRRDTPTLLALRALGARVRVGHDAGARRRRRHRRGLHRHPRRQPRARRRPASAGCGCCPAPWRSPSVMAGRRGVAVAGTHGKTSTTSMLTVAVQACGVDPSFAIGGDLNESGSNAHAGAGRRVRRRGRRERPLVPAARPVRRDRHQRRGRPPRQLRRPRRGRGGLRPRSCRRVDPRRLRRRLRRRPGRGAAARRRRRRAGCAPTARRRTPTCGSATSRWRPTARATPAVLDGRRPRPGADPGCPASTWPSTARPRCWPGSSSGCPSTG